MKNVILIVDDENDVREMFIKFLEKKGFDTVAASDALSAMRALKRGGIDLVLSDYQMPEMTGIELLQEIFKMHPTIPVILMSGNADMRVAVEAIREKAFDFLQKPVNSSELLQTVNLALHRQTSTVTSINQNGKGIGPVYCSRSDDAPSVTILELNRPLDEYSQKSFEIALNRLLTDGEIQKNVIVGLKNVTYINNVGMNYLLSTYNSLKTRGHSIVLTQLSDPVYKYLKLLGYLEYFPNTMTLKDALSFFPIR